MSRFQHFLITRFNVKASEWALTKSGEDVTSETWLKHRFHLFETYCLPSIKQQTNLNFKWLVCFDSDTPENYKVKIKNIHDAFSNFIPLYVDNASLVKPLISKTIVAHISPKHTHIITSRLDNDDGLHRNYIDTVQQHFIPKPSFIIDIVSGFQLITTSNQLKIRKLSTPFNPFVSLIEDTTAIKTVLDRWHRDWEGHPHKSITDNPLWLQVIHDKNISNSEKLQFQETNHFSASDFGMTTPVKLKSNVNIALSTVINNFKRLFLKLKSMTR